MKDRAPVALITGAAGGIGESLVKVFSEAGYRVIAMDYTESGDRLPNVSYLLADLELYVNDARYADVITDQILGLIGDYGLNVLINNAAIQTLGGVDCLTRYEWRRSLDVNVTAPFLLSKALLSPLEQVTGSIINISSIHARLTKREFVAYATSKAALSGLTRAMSVDLGDRIRINAIEPAAIETPMLLAGFSEQPEKYRELKSCHSVNRIATPEEFARFTLAVAAGDYGFMHGACVPFDGGISSRLHDPA